MAEPLFVKPREGLTVPDPRTRQALPAEGAVVPRTGYWARRLRDGDVVEADSGRRGKPTLRAVPSPKKDGDK